MTKVSNNDIARAIYGTIKEKAHEEGVLPKIVQFLSRKRLLTRKSGILSALSKIINQEEGRVVAKVSSKDALDAKTKEEITKAISERYGAKEVELALHIDETLIGGFKIQVEDEVVDLSIKNKISKLQAHLIHA